MDNLIQLAQNIIATWRPENYLFGYGALTSQTLFSAHHGKRAHLIYGHAAFASGLFERVTTLLTQSNITISGSSLGAAPNSPTEDVERVYHDLINSPCDMVITLGGGSLIDAAKASIAVTALGGSCEDYFGTNLVSKALTLSGKSLLPHLAIMTASASAAHLTRYANVTSLANSQKKLIIDNAIQPQEALFDYSVTTSMSRSFTLTGAFDGIGHLSEVYYGFPETDDRFALLERAVLYGIELILTALPTLLKKPTDRGARTALGLGTDLGGFAIMTGSTNGPHLNSFSLVDVADHGKSVALLQPYWGAFFTPAIPVKIKKLCAIYQKTGFLPKTVHLGAMPSPELGKTYVAALHALYRQVGFPCSLHELSGCSPAHIERMIAAAKNPQLAAKLQAMPVAVSSESVEQVMRPLLNAAYSGDLALIPSIKV